MSKNKYVEVLPCHFIDKRVTLRQKKMMRSTPAPSPWWFITFPFSHPLFMIAGSYPSLTILQGGRSSLGSWLQSTCPLLLFLPTYSSRLFLYLYSVSLLSTVQSILFPLFFLSLSLSTSSVFWSPLLFSPLFLSEWIPPAQRHQTHFSLSQGS